MLAVLTRADMKRGQTLTCIFCRQEVAKRGTHEETMKRVEANDPVALVHVGKNFASKGEYAEVFRFCCADLGSGSAQQNLSVLYCEGKHLAANERRAIYHLEEAAIAGQPDARFNLGLLEWDEGCKERAVKHFIIVANLGDDESVQMLKHVYARMDY